VQAAGRVDDLVGDAAAGGMADNAIAIGTGSVSIIPTTRTGNRRLAVVTIDIGAGSVGRGISRIAISSLRPDQCKGLFRRKVGIVSMIAIVGINHVAVAADILLLGIGGTVAVVCQQLGNIFTIDVIGENRHMRRMHTAVVRRAVITEGIGTVRPVVILAGPGCPTAVTGVATGDDSISRRDHVKTPAGGGERVLAGSGAVVWQVTGITTGKAGIAAGAAQEVGVAGINRNLVITMITRATPIVDADGEGVTGARLDTVAIPTLVGATGPVNRLRGGIGPMGNPAVPSAGPVAVAAGTLAAGVLVGVLVPLARPGTAGAALAMAGGGAGRGRAVDESGDAGVEVDGRCAVLENTVPVAVGRGRGMTIGTVAEVGVGRIVTDG